jgi:hypothetical protein
VITTSTVTQATVNVPYIFFVEATGGTGTYTWALTGGSLPPGLSFSDQTAEITGTPTLLGNYSFTLKVTDQASMSDSANLTMTVGGALIIDCNSCSTQYPMALPSGSPGVPYSATLSVTGGVAPYTWCVFETNGTCDNGSGGGLPPGLKISTSTDGHYNGIISGTPTTPGTPTNFTVRVTDSEQTHSQSEAPLTLTIMGIVTAALPPGYINIAYNQNITAAGGQEPYTWTITSGQLPPGLFLEPGSCVDSRLPTCTISGTPTVPGTYSFTAQVRDGETPPSVATEQFSITVAGITNSSLNGNYVFSFSGYSGSNSSPVVMAGAFVADGNGNLAPPAGGSGNGGELDVNNGTGEANTGCGGSGPQQQTIIPGPAPGSTYSLQSNGLGTMNIVTSSATYNFQIAIRPDGSGSLIQNNADPNTRGSGTIKVQTKGVTLAQIEGNFTVGVTGADPSGNRYAAAGWYGLNDPNGDLTCTNQLQQFICPLDIDDGGTLSQQHFIGTLSTTLDSFGRGCFVDLTFEPSGDHFTYAYYITSANELVIISTDALGGGMSNNANLTLWSVRRQIVGAGGLSNQNLTGKTVLELSAQDTNGAADVTTGLFVGQGSSSNMCENGAFDNATFTFDQNQGGTLTQQQTVTGQYCVDNTIRSGDNAPGRVTLQGFNGIWSTNPPVFYLGGNDPGFVVGTDDAVTSGGLETQTGAPYTNASVNLNYWGGTFLPPISAVTDSVTSLLADGNGNITGTQYTSGPGGPGGPTNLTLTYSVDSTGRALVMQNGNVYGILYVVSPTKFVLLPANTTPALNIFSQAGF